MDGHAVTVKRSKVTRPRQVVKIKAEGMPRHEYPSEFGPLGWQVARWVGGWVGFAPGSPFFGCDRPL